MHKDVRCISVLVPIWFYDSAMLLAAQFPYIYCAPQKPLIPYEFTAFPRSKPLSKKYVLFLIIK